MPTASTSMTRFVCAKIHISRYCTVVLFWTFCWMSVCICRICECTKVYKCKCKCKCKLETNLYAVYIVHQECMHYFDNGTLRASELLHLLHYCIDPFWPLRLALSPILSSTVYRTINNHSLSSKTFSALQYPLHSSPTPLSSSALSTTTTLSTPTSSHSPT